MCARERKGREYCAMPRKASKAARPDTSRVFMLTHGKEVRRVSFFQGALKALFIMAFRMVGKVSFWVRSGYFLTFISVKYSTY